MSFKTTDTTYLSRLIPNEAQFTRYLFNQAAQWGCRSCSYFPARGYVLAGAVASAISAPCYIIRASNKSSTKIIDGKIKEGISCLWADIKTALKLLALSIASVGILIITLPYGAQHFNQFHSIQEPLPQHKNELKEHIHKLEEQLKNTLQRKLKGQNEKNILLTQSAQQIRLLKKENTGLQNSQSTQKQAFDKLSNNYLEVIQELEKKQTIKTSQTPIKTQLTADEKLALVFTYQELIQTEEKTLKTYELLHDWLAAFLTEYGPSISLQEQHCLNEIRSSLSEAIHGSKGFLKELNTIPSDTLTAKQVLSTMASQQNYFKLYYSKLYKIPHLLSTLLNSNKNIKGIASSIESQMFTHFETYKAANMDPILQTGIQAMVITTIQRYPRILLLADNLQKLSLVRTDKEMRLIKDNALKMNENTRLYEHAELGAQEILYLFEEYSKLSGFFSSAGYIDDAFMNSEFICRDSFAYAEKLLATQFPEKKNKWTEFCSRMKPKLMPKRHFVSQISGKTPEETSRRQFEILVRFFIHKKGSLSTSEKIQFYKVFDQCESIRAETLFDSKLENKYKIGNNKRYVEELQANLFNRMVSKRMTAYENLQEENDHSFDLQFAFWGSRLKGIEELKQKIPTKMQSILDTLTQFEKTVEL